MARSEKTPEQKTSRRAERRFRNIRSTLLVNGWLLILGAFLLSVIAVHVDIQKHGLVLGVLGTAVCALWLVSGFLMVRSSKRMKRPTWLRILQFRNTSQQDAKPSEDPSSPERVDD
ncbi:MAG: hypothetical protein JW818_10745 [Pirellulales bacterium]|nr:hypothetical protein [Pirellulales bacterium]